MNRTEITGITILRAHRGLALGALLALGSSELCAQTQPANHGTETALIVTGMLTAIVVLLTFFIVIVLGGDINPLTRFFRRAYGAVSPKSASEAIPLDEDHDGITELDNRVPPWFNYLFGGTIVFAALYMLDYHVWGSSPLPRAEYAQELAAADISRRVRIASEGAINEDALEPLKDEASINAGHEQFTKNCVTCHGANGGGIVGPNLTDQYWINGGGIKNIYTAIKNGVPQRGMISWKLVFTPKEIQQIASFVLTLQGTNPANGKKPEGSLYQEPSPQKDDVKAQK
jgi:cytochrome c oxidase cbb3-type subunit 3